MPPLALCSRPACDFRVELQDWKIGASVPTPRACPKCEAPMTCVCPECGILLNQIEEGKHPRCPVCRTDVRRAFARIAFGLHRPSPRLKSDPPQSEPL
jgi:predicted amidophosphoribosyltransferase